MISALHLLWIVPTAASLGFFAAVFLSINKNKD